MSFLLKKKSSKNFEMYPPRQTSHFEDLILDVLNYKKNEKANSVSSSVVCLFVQYDSEKGRLVHWFCF